MAIKFDNIEAINLKNHAGTNVLTLNSSNTNALFAGNVGIGMTSAPAGKLEINGGTGVATSGGTLIVRQDGDTSNDGIALTSSNAISHRMFKNAGGAFLMGPSTDSGAFALDLNGNVGIGTGANVDEKLHIQGSVDNDDIALKIENNFDNNSSANPPSAAVLFQTASNNGHIRVFGAPADTAANHRMDVGSTAGSSYLTFSPSGTEKMRIAANGYVGIGTEDPLTNLHVSSGTSGNATVIIEADTDNNQENDLPRLWFKADGGITEGAIQLSDNQLDIISNCNFASGIVFKTGNTNNTGDTDPATGAVQRMIITNDGNVEIGDKNYSYGGDNYHIGLKSTISSQDKTAYISNIQGSVVISAGGYYYGSNLRQLNSSNTTYGGIVLTEAGDFRIESLSGGTAGNTAGTSNKFIVASNGATTTYGNYIRSQHDGNHYAQIENNSSGGVLKAVSGGTTSVMFRSYGDSYITNDLGIGVTGPSQKLHVNGNVTADRYYGNGSTTYYVDPNNTTQSAYFAGDIRITDSSYATIKLDSTNTYPGAKIIATKNGSESPPYGSIDWQENPGFAGSKWSQRLSYSPYTESLIQLPSSSSYDFYIKVLGSHRMTIDSSTGDVGIATTIPRAKLDVNGGIRMADDTSAAASTNVGTLRYRTSGNNSYVDMCMQTGASTYEWVNIVQNSW